MKWGNVMSLPDIKLTLASGEIYPLSDYQGEVLLIVNTATGCGLAPQFTALETLHEQYAAKGLRVLGFPCGQFANQETVSDKDMVGVCQIKFNVTFPMHARLNVNGEHTHPLYQWLKREQSGLLGGAVKWNFTKFLVNRQGQVVKRYAPQTEPKNIEKDILKLLNV